MAIPGIGKYICKLTGRHYWIKAGGRPCPYSPVVECFQIAYKCIICGAVDDGSPESPSFMACLEYCEDGFMPKPVKPKKVRK